MSQEPEPVAPAGNALEQKLAKFQALYDRYGRDGLRDQPLADIQLFLASKQMLLRDAAKRDLSDQEKADNRRLELEIKDITGFLKGQMAGLSLADLRSSSPSDRPRQEQFRGKGRGMER